MVVKHALERHFVYSAALRDKSEFFGKAKLPAVHFFSGTPKNFFKRGGVDFGAVCRPKQVI